MAYFGSIMCHTAHFGAITRHAKTLCHPTSELHVALVSSTDLQCKVSSANNLAQQVYKQWNSHATCLVLAAELEVSEGAAKKKQTRGN